MLVGRSAPDHRGRGAAAPAVGLRPLSCRDEPHDRRRRARRRAPCSPSGRVSTRTSRAGVATPSTRPRSGTEPASSRRRPMRARRTPASRRSSRRAIRTAGCRDKELPRRAGRPRERVLRAPGLELMSVVLAAPRASCSTRCYARVRPRTRRRRRGARCRLPAGSSPRASRSPCGDPPRAEAGRDDDPAGCTVGEDGDPLAGMSAGGSSDALISATRASRAASSISNVTTRAYSGICPPLGSAFTLFDGGANSRPRSCRLLPLRAVRFPGHATSSGVRSCVAACSIWSIWTVIDAADCDPSTVRDLLIRSIYWPSTSNR